MLYKTFQMDSAPHGADGHLYVRRSVNAFLTSFAATLLLACFAAGMLYVDQTASSLGVQETFQSDALWPGDSRPGGILSALGRVVGYFFPYLDAAFRLFMLLCAFFTFIARTFDR